MAERLSKGENISYLFDQEEEEEEEEQTQDFFTHGSHELALCRKKILGYSIPRAIARQKAHLAELSVPFVTRKKMRHEWYTSLKDYEAISLQFGDDRPMGFCSFAPNSKLLATSSWSGLVKLWSIPQSEQVSIYKGHKDRVSCIDFHPRSTLNQPCSVLNFASGATDGTVHLWALDQ